MPGSSTGIGIVGMGGGIGVVAVGGGIRVTTRVPVPIPSTRRASGRACDRLAMNFRKVSVPSFGCGWTLTKSQSSVKVWPFFAR